MQERNKDELIHRGREMRASCSSAPHSCLSNPNINVRMMLHDRVCILTITTNLHATKMLYDCERANKISARLCTMRFSWPLLLSLVGIRQGRVMYSISERTINRLDHQSNVPPDASRTLRFLVFNCLESTGAFSLCCAVRAW